MHILMSPLSRPQIACPAVVFKWGERGMGWRCRDGACADGSAAGCAEHGAEGVGGGLPLPQAGLRGLGGHAVPHQSARCMGRTGRPGCRVAPRAGVPPGMCFITHSPH